LMGQPFFMFDSDVFHNRKQRYRRHFPDGFV